MKTAIIALVATSVFGAVLFGYGNAKYNEGFTNCKVEFAEKIAENAKQAAKKREAAHVQANKGHDIVLAGMASSGWLRD